MSNEVMREWHPGDGVRCKYFKRAPQHVPCGKPVVTRVITVSPVRGKPRIVTSPLCANHADVGAALPGKWAAAGERAARERLVTEHYETYLRYVAEETAKVVGAQGGAA